MGACYVAQRVVERGQVITAAGASSGIEMALVLLDRQYGPIVAQSAQLALEYDPRPPFPCRHTPQSPHPDRRAGATPTLAHQPLGQHIPPTVIASPLPEPAPEAGRRRAADPQAVTGSVLGRSRHRPAPFRASMMGQCNQARKTPRWKRPLPLWIWPASPP